MLSHGKTQLLVGSATAPTYQGRFLDRVLTPGKFLQELPVEEVSKGLHKAGFGIVVAHRLAIDVKEIVDLCRIRRPTVFESRQENLVQKVLLAFEAVPLIMSQTAFKAMTVADRADTYRSVAKLVLDRAEYYLPRSKEEKNLAETLPGADSGATSRPDIFPLESKADSGIGIPDDDDDDEFFAGLESSSTESARMAKLIYQCPEPQHDFVISRRLERGIIAILAIHDVAVSDLPPAAKAVKLKEIQDQYRPVKTRPPIVEKALHVARQTLPPPQAGILKMNGMKPISLAYN